MAEAPVKNQVILNEEDNVMLPEREMIAYGVSGFAICITFIYNVAFTQFFWTDVLKIPATLVGAYMIFGKTWDALNDLIVAWFVDRSKWKKGFYIPWEWSFIPMCFFQVIVMTRGNGSKFFWFLSMTAYVFYTLSETFWEVANMASQSTMTLSYRCRHKLTAHRQFGANISASIVGVCVIPLATWFGKGDFAAGWTKAAIVWAIVPAPFYLWAIFGRKERFKPIKEGAKIPLKESIKCLAHNKPAWMVILAHLAWGVQGGFAGSSKNYFWTYVYGDVNLITVSGFYNTGSMLAAAITVMIIAGRVKNKRNIPLVSWTICGLAQVIAALLPPNSANKVPILILGAIAGWMGQVGFINLFSIAPDVTEYSQKVHGLRNAGFIFGAINLAFQIGNALVSGVFVIILGAAGYVAGQAQTPLVLTLIRLGSFVLPGASMLLGALCWLGYRLDEDTHNAAIHELSRK
jgi:Na+/melibiose symporter-like transporter